MSADINAYLIVNVHLAPGIMEPTVGYVVPNLGFSQLRDDLATLSVTHPDVVQEVPLNVIGLQQYRVRSAELHEFIEENPHFFDSVSDGWAEFIRLTKKNPDAAWWIRIE